MTHDKTTADAVAGPGGTPPGPSPVGPDPAVDPVFSDGDATSTADPALPGTPATLPDPSFSGEPGTPAGRPSDPVPAHPVEPAGEVTPTFMGEPTAPAEPAIFAEPTTATGDPAAVVPVGAVEPLFAEPAAAGPSLVDSADRPAEQQTAEDRPAPGAATLPPEAAPAARTLFGDRLDLAAAYAELLATDGVVRGLIGPREAPRIWERHLLNCAAMAERIPEGASLLDVGSGAGLPGLVLAIARPDLTVTLVEPLARRTAFLVEAVQQLGLTRTVRVFRGRAEDAAAGTRDSAPLSADIVTARAVAALDRLTAWCLPLVVPGGRLVALKGASAAEEIAEHAEAVARLGGGEPELHRCGVGVIDPPAVVIEVVRERVVGPVRKKGPKRSRGGRRRGGSGRDR
ncbi:16S rRNA (guanine527-N7)-methyltransferase [Micromonospora narathiwatensis]|uniref:Ribosomal RNA small subunit methyltransferase G n=1 Tax=Micromonospora narathiwatensis TaxID=299146 RepID=A0A1A9AB27_9ACTN|nr:16S rRNA (guanine527-N7)-methyltransferase [Micromonospora narathiwatensis]